MNEYISIKEFATRAGVSPQAVYQRLERDLKPYFKVIKGKKSLEIKGLELFSLNNFKQELKDVEQDFKQGFKDNFKINQENINIELIDTLKETLKTLNKQLEVKDIQIAELNERLKEAQELNRNNQILLGSEQSRTNPALLMGDNEAKQDKKQPLKKKSFWNSFKKS